jgi:cytochrome oxidase assembly protein ShyY1
LKLVTVKGYFDYTQEYLVEKYQEQEKGYEVICPLYTHIDQNGDKVGILINRGWVPYDLMNLRLHIPQGNYFEITGFLYKGDNKTKYNYPNEPSFNTYTRVDPSDFSLMVPMKNFEETSQFMVKQVDLDDNLRQLLPTCPSISKLDHEWRIKSERHNAYASMWKYTTFLGILANSAIWVYF